MSDTKIDKASPVSETHSTSVEVDPVGVQQHPVETEEITVPADDAASVTTDVTILPTDDNDEPGDKPDMSVRPKTFPLTPSRISMSHSSEAPQQTSISNLNYC